MVIASKSKKILLWIIVRDAKETEKDLQQIVEMLTADFFMISTEVQYWGEFQTEDRDNSVEEAQ
jgi:hypothetical protein